MLYAKCRNRPCLIPKHSATGYRRWNFPGNKTPMTYMTESMGMKV